MAITERTVFVTADQKTFTDRSAAELHEGRLEIARLFSDLGDGPAIGKRIEAQRGKLEALFAAIDRRGSDESKQVQAVPVKTPAPETVAAEVSDTDPTGVVEAAPAKRPTSSPRMKPAAARPEHDPSLDKNDTEESELLADLGEPQAAAPVSEDSDSNRRRVMRRRRRS